MISRSFMASTSRWEVMEGESSGVANIDLAGAEGELPALYGTAR